MKYINFRNLAVVIAVSAFTAVGCKKTIKEPAPMGDAGQTLVKIINGGDPAHPGINKNPVDFVAIPKTIVAADIRRDIPNASELNKAMTITVKNDDAAVAAANPAYIILPAAWYTIGTGTPYSGGNYNISLSPGEFAKQIMITIPDATLLNPSALYALGFTITTTDANGVISSEKSVVAEIGAKNAYDGIYSVVSGNVQRYTGPGVAEVGPLNGDLTGNPDVILTTVGAQRVQFPTSGQAGRLEWAFTAGGSGVAGIDGLTATVDPVTNLVTMASAGNATLGNWAGKLNSWEPGPKVLNLAFRWNPTSTTREYEIVLKYKGPR